MTDQLRINSDYQSENAANIKVLAILDKIEHSTAVTKGWMTFFGILVIIALVIYLVITFMGMATILNLFTNILG